MHKAGTFFKGVENEHSGSSSYWLVIESGGSDGLHGRVLCLYNRWRDELVGGVKYRRVPDKPTGAVVMQIPRGKVPSVARRALEEAADDVCKLILCPECKDRLREILTSLSGR